MRTGRIFSKDSTFRTLFHFGEEHAKGRSCMLISSIILVINNYLTTGIFYTGFLMGNDIDIVHIGVLSLLPFLANLFGVFSPLILERFQRRKRILTLSRATYYTLHILGVTVVPYFAQSTTIKVVCFGVLIFAANVINALFIPGYQAWQVNFIPNKVRANYLSISQIFSNGVSSVVILLSSFAADALKGSPHEMTVMFALRYVAYVIAIADVIVLALPKEYPYAKAARVKLKNIVVLPLRHKKFLLTMLIVFTWTYFQYLTVSPLDYYLLNNVGVQYTFINLINASYALFLIFFSRYWKGVLGKYSWFTTFALSGILHGPTNLLYAFISSTNYLWLMPTVRLTQHFLGVGLNLTFANMVFVNLPQADRTNYISFHLLAINLASLLGMATSTGFLSATQTISWNVLGFSLTSVPILLILQAAGQTLVAAAVFKLRPYITPKEGEVY